ncbi:reverse transcriptase domain-containing protein [Tanacetum coccineum]
MPSKRTSTSETPAITLAAIQQLITNGISSALKAQAASMAKRFQELAVLCPNMVPNAEKLVEVFINGLPRSIEGNVTASKPQTLEEAINIAQRLMDQIIKHDSVQEANDHKRKLEDKGNIINNNYQNNYNNNNRNNDHHQQQNRKQETFRTYTATNGYTGNHPLCERCTLHHIDSQNANPLALVAARQYPNIYYQAPKYHKSYAPPSKQSSSTRSYAPTRHKGKEIAKPITLHLSQLLKKTKYAMELLKRAHMLNFNLTRIPVDTKSKLGPGGTRISDPTLYRSLAGGLQYLTFTHLDLSYGTLEFGLQLYASLGSSLMAYFDVDWVGCPCYCRSTSGEVRKYTKLTEEEQTLLSSWKQGCYFFDSDCIGDEIYSTVDECNTAKEMWTARLERLHQGESFERTDVKTIYFGILGSLLQEMEESMESDDSRFYNCYE